MIGEGDKSLPLLAIAAAAGGEWPARSRLALLHFFGLRSAADEGTGHCVLLLTDLKAIFAETGSDRLPSVDMCTRLAHMGERPWPEWRNSKPITQVELARALAPFICGAGGDRPSSRSRLLRAGGCAPARASRFNDFAGAAAQCCDPKWRPGVSRDDSAVACRAICSPPQAGQACA